MQAFLTKTFPFVSCLSKILLSLKYFMKNYAIVEISVKKKMICDTGSINVRIRANEADRFTDFYIKS